MTSPPTVQLWTLRDGCPLCGDEHAIGSRVVLAQRSEDGKRLASCARHFEENEARRKAMGLSMARKETTYHRANLRVVTS